MFLSNSFGIKAFQHIQDYIVSGDVYQANLTRAAYVGFGHGNTENGNLTIYNDFHRYDPVADEWTPLGDFPGEARVAGTQFAKDGYGYILSGDGDKRFWNDLFFMFLGFATFWVEYSF